MGNSLTKYIEWVELESFFSGYLLVYAIIYLVASNLPVSNFVKIKVLPNLPLAYALVGTLYLGLQLKNEYPNYHINYFVTDIQFPYLKIWGLLSIFFWIPVLHKKAVFSLLHNLVFFILLLRSFYLQLSIPSVSNDLARNNIKIYTASIILNLITLILVTFISLLIARFKKHLQRLRIPSSDPSHPVSSLSRAHKSGVLCQRQMKIDPLTASEN